MTKARDLSAVPNQSLGFKNRIINGDMRIDQRNNGASVTVLTTTGYTLDRWKTACDTSSKFSVQQDAGGVTAPAGFTDYLGVTSLSAYSVPAGEIYGLQHHIEGYNVADLNWGTANAQPVTLSFWVRSSLTGTFGGSFINASSNRSYPFTYSISSANTWEQKSITVAGDTSGTWNTTNGRGIVVIFSLGTGSTFSGTAGSWSGNNFQSATGATSVVGTNGATWYITGVQLERGSTATSFDTRSYGTELELCQRYFQVLGNANEDSFGMGCYYNSTAVFGATLLSTEMRTVPTIYQTTGTNYYYIFRANTNDGFSSVSLGDGTSNKAVEYFNNSEVSGTAGDAGFMRLGSSLAIFALQAEL